jgi:hypothetical protein
MPDYLAEFRCRLAELGCPPARLDRMAREIADHRDDLMAAAVREGVASPAASAEAALGQPGQLAENLMVSYRQAHWCGRHPLMVFGFLPLTFPLLWLACIVFQFLICYGVIGGLVYGWDAQKIHLAGDDPVVYHRGVILVGVIDYVAIALGTGLFCWLARRSGVGRIWMFIACLTCAAYGVFLNVGVDPHHLFVGLFNSPQHWSQAATPILIALAACLYQYGQIRAARGRLSA